MTTDIPEPTEIETLASRFAEYLEIQTDAQIPAPDSVSEATLVESVERLDAALNQLMDLASIYGSDPRLDIEPLALPSAALYGEYLRHATGGAWKKTGDGHDESLIMTFDGAGHVDVLAAVRGSLFSGMSNLAAMARDVIAANSRSS
ncbi:MAG: hypothetical protein ACOC9Y_01330 [Chloroflexota bacterium]